MSSSNLISTDSPSSLFSERLVNDDMYKTDAFLNGIQGYQSNPDLSNT